MKFRCKKTLEFPWFEENNPTWYKKASPFRYPFIAGEIYESWDKGTSRTRLELINESGMNHSVGMHWLHWKFDKFFREYFIRIED